MSPIFLFFTFSSVQLFKYFVFRISVRKPNFTSRNEKYSILFIIQCFIKLLLMTVQTIMFLPSVLSVLERREHIHHVLKYLYIFIPSLIINIYYLDIYLFNVIINSKKNRVSNFVFSSSWDFVLYIYTILYPNCMLIETHSNCLVYNISMLLYFCKSSIFCYWFLWQNFPLNLKK